MDMKNLRMFLLEKLALLAKRQKLFTKGQTLLENRVDNIHWTKRMEFAHYQDFISGDKYYALFTLAIALFCLLGGLIFSLDFLFAIAILFAAFAGIFFFLYLLNYASLEIAKLKGGSFQPVI